MTAYTNPQGSIGQLSIGLNKAMFPVLPDFAGLANKSGEVGEEMDVLGVIAGLVLNAIGVITMARDPENAGYVTEGEMLVRGRTTKEKPGKPRAVIPDIFSPRWLGEPRPAVRYFDLGGTHASPVGHWRRGHWRQQPHGEGNKLRRLIWIKPARVNKEDE